MSEKMFTLYLPQAVDQIDFFTLDCHECLPLDSKLT
jgi:hypothetical protein